jgi:hypothetical protein
MKTKIVRVVMANKTLRRVTFFVARRQVKKRSRRYIKIGIVLAVATAVVAAYLASRRSSGAPDELSPVSQ